MKPTVPALSAAHERALELVGDRWGMWLLVAIDPEHGARFVDLAAQPGLSRRTLSERLQRLVDGQLVERQQYSVHPPRHRYRLTERGVGVHRLVVALLHVAAGGTLARRPAEAAPVPREALPASRQPVPAPARAAAGDIPPAVGDSSPQEPAPHPTDRLLGTDLDAAWEIYRETVAPLVRYDDQYRTQLTDTLDTYLACDASVSVTAARLYAHRHTIRYRLGRVQELTGLDVDATADRERLVLGLRAMRIFQKHGRDLLA